MMHYCDPGCRWQVLCITDSEAYKIMEIIYYNNLALHY